MTFWCLQKLSTWRNAAAVCERTGHTFATHEFFGLYLGESVNHVHIYMRICRSGTSIKEDAILHRILCKVVTCQSDCSSCVGRISTAAFVKSPRVGFYWTLGSRVCLFYHVNALVSNIKFPEVFPLFWLRPAEPAFRSVFTCTHSIVRLHTGRQLCVVCLLTWITLSGLEFRVKMSYCVHSYESSPIVFVKLTDVDICFLCFVLILDSCCPQTELHNYMFPGSSNYRVRKCPTSNGKIITIA